MPPSDHHHPPMSGSALCGGQASVYLITNVINEHVYVGKSINPSRRWARHVRDAKNGSDLALHRAIRKYGEECFHVEKVQTFLTEPEAYEAETGLIELLRSENKILYNENDGGLGGVRPTLELREKISKRVKESLRHVNMDEVRAERRYKENLSIGVRRHFSVRSNRDRARRAAKEHWRKYRNKMLASMQTPESRDRRSLAHLGSKRSLVVVDPIDVSRIINDLNNLGPGQACEMWSLSYHAVQCIGRNDYRRWVLPLVQLLKERLAGISDQDLILRHIPGARVQSRLLAKIIAGTIEPSPLSSTRDEWLDLIKKCHS